MPCCKSLINIILKFDYRVTNLLFFSRNLKSPNQPFTLTAFFQYKTIGYDQSITKNELQNFSQ